jgi:hypothetical protein
MAGLFDQFSAIDRKAPFRFLSAMAVGTMLAQYRNDFVGEIDFGSGDESSCRTKQSGDANRKC